MLDQSWQDGSIIRSPCRYRSILTHTSGPIKFSMFLFWHAGTQTPWHLFFKCVYYSLVVVRPFYHQFDCRNQPRRPESTRQGPLWKSLADDLCRSAGVGRDPTGVSSVGPIGVVLELWPSGGVQTEHPAYLQNGFHLDDRSFGAMRTKHGTLVIPPGVQSHQGTGATQRMSNSTEGVLFIKSLHCTLCSNFTTPWHCASFRRLRLGMKRSTY